LAAEANPSIVIGWSQLASMNCSAMRTCHGAAAPGQSSSVRYSALPFAATIFRNQPEAVIRR
jgi:hypothetical protein